METIYYFGYGHIAYPEVMEALLGRRPPQIISSVTARFFYGRLLHEVKISCNACTQIYLLTGIF